jgi:hypothetical protein
MGDQRSGRRAAPRAGLRPVSAHVFRTHWGTALHCAAREGSVDCVAAIRGIRGAPHRGAESTYQGTPLSWCAHGSVNCGSPRADHVAVARLLIAAGARVSREMLDWGGSDAFQAVLEEAVRSA